MEKHELIELLNKIESVYPQFKMTDDTVLMWYRVCRNMEFNLVMGRLMTHIMKSPYPPMIAEVAVFSGIENRFLHQTKHWEQEGRERIERDQQLGRGKPVPSWLSERTAR